MEAGINRNAALQETPAAAPTERKKGFILAAAAALLRRLPLAPDEEAQTAADSR